MPGPRRRRRLPRLSRQRTRPEPRFERAGGQDYAIAYAAVPGTEWRLLLREPWHGLTTPPILLEQWTPFVLLIAVSVSFLTLLFGLLFVVRPLRLLSDSTRRIGQGDFTAASAPVGGVDEIEDLRQSVDQMAQQIQGYQAGLQSYLHAVTRAQEEERARLARELHDETIQTLTALDHKVQKLQRALEREPESIRQSLDELHTMAAGATAEVRRFSRALRPLYLEDLGLAPALELLAKESGAGFTLVGTPAPHPARSRAGALPHCAGIAQQCPPPRAGNPSGGDACLCTQRGTADYLRRWRRL